MYVCIVRFAGQTPQGFKQDFRKLKVSVPVSSKLRFTELIRKLQKKGWKNVEVIAWDNIEVKRTSRRRKRKEEAPTDSL